MHCCNVHLIDITCKFNLDISIHIDQHARIYISASVSTFLFHGFMSFHLHIYNDFLCIYCERSITSLSYCYRFEEVVISSVCMSPIAIFHMFLQYKHWNVAAGWGRDLMRYKGKLWH